MAGDVLSRVTKWHECFVQCGKVACGVLSSVAKLHGCLSRVARWHVMFCQGWQNCMDVYFRVAKWHVMFCRVWQSGM